MLCQQLVETQACNNLLSGLLLNFINLDPANFDEEIEKALGIIGKFARADRCFVFQLNETKERMTYTHEWCAKGTKSHKKLWQQVSVSKFPWFAKQLKKGSVIKIRSLKDLPKEAKAFGNILKRRGHKSLMTVPMVFEGDLIGFLGFANGKSELEWHDDSEPLLRIVGEIIANALYRIDVESKLQEEHALLDRRVREMNCLYSISKASESPDVLLEEVLQAIAEILPSAFAFADDACVRISVKDQKFLSPKFKATPWCLKRELVTSTRRIGWVEVFYKHKHPDKDEGPFDAHERKLLNEVGEKIEDIYIELTSDQNIQELSELRSKFIHSISHEMRTPLSGIRWTLELLLDEDMGTLDKSQKSMVRMAYEGINHAIHRVSDLLRAVEIGEGKVTIEKHLIDLEAVWASIEADFKKKCRIHNIQLRCKRPSTPLPVVLADPVMMHDVFTKIMDNAVDYTPAEGRINVTISHKDDHIRFQVTDTGIGIPSEQQQRIFNRFFRATNAYKIKTHASGVSLSIVDFYVRQHGGRVDFKSKEGKGSTFWVDIPVRKKAN